MKRILLKDFGVIFICLFVSSFFLMIVNNDYTIADQINYQDDDFRNDQMPETAADDPNGKPLLVHQYANISKVFNGIDSGENVSFTLYDDWISQNTTINYEGITQKRNIVNNGAFDSDDSGWIFKTNIPSTWSKLTWQDDKGYPDPDGCTGIYGDNDGKSIGDYGYFEQNITLPDEKLWSDLATFSFNYYSEWDINFNATLFMSVIVGNTEINHSIYTTDISPSSWFTLSMDYNPVTYGQVLPGEVIIRVGAIMNENNNGWLQLYLDNFNFEIWSESNEAGIIKVLDHQFLQNYTYYNTTFGEGYSFIDNERSPDSDHQIDFTIYSNRSGFSDFHIDKITLTAHAIKIFNSTVSNKLGSLYSMGENISWQVEFSLIINHNYYCWVFIEKPSDWEFIHAIDSFEEEKIGFCLGKGLGSDVMEIPLDYISAGFWKLEAISKNYIENGNIGKWDDFQFINATRLTHGDKFLVNISLDDSVILLNSEINCTIFYPNASVFWQDSKEPTTNNEKFGNFTVGKNMTVGNYLVIIQWVNNPSPKEIDKIGYIELEFIVWHHSILTAVNPFFEIVTGDPLLVKVKLTDTDVNSSISIATVKYNSTFGQSGTMIYGGSGIYLADLDTSSLDLGSYFISVNTTTNYYENQSIVNLIQLNVIAQSLVLDVPHTVIEAMANDYAICQVNVTGAISGAMILNVTIETDWQNTYNVIDHNNGSYTLNFSTVDLPTQGIIETFSVSLYANKTDYGETSGFITMTIHPIQAIINVNTSTIRTKINEIKDIKINYTIEESGLLINGANYSVLWSSLFNIIPDGQGIILQLNTVNLSIETYTAEIKVEKVGYETVYKIITVIVDYIEFDLDPINFEESIETFTGVTSMITIKLLDPDTLIPIDNATVFYDWEFGNGYFDFIDNGTYELGLNIPQNIKGNYKITFKVSKQDTIYKYTEFSFIISVEPPSQSTSFPWFILPILIAVISILGIVSLRSYVFIPYKHKKESNLLAKTQRYKDTMNIETILISDRQSGIHIYSKSYYLLKGYQSELLTGFIQAITLISNEIVGKEKLEKISIKSDKYKGIEKIIELDFKHFNFFISDYKDLRVIFILKDKASERFKNKAAEFLSSLDMKVSDKLKRWDGTVNAFNDVLPPLLETHFHLSYREKFKINPDINITRITKEGEFSKIGKRLLNVIVSMNRVQEEFYLEDTLTTFDGKNKDKLIEALEILITNQTIISTIGNNK